MTVFIDTGIFVPLRNADDEFYTRSKELMKRALRIEFGRVFTSEYVIDEAITTALARTRRHDFLANTTAAIKHLIFMKNSSTQSSILIKNASRTLLLASSSTAYLGDILNYRLAKVRVEEHPPSYFGVTPNFINALKG